MRTSTNIKVGYKNIEGTCSAEAESLFIEEALILNGRFIGWKVTEHYSNRNGDFTETAFFNAANQFVSPSLFEAHAGETKLSVYL